MLMPEYNSVYSKFSEYILIISENNFLLLLFDTNIAFDTLNLILQEYFLEGIFETESSALS